MTAARSSGTPVDSEIPSAKRHCGHYSLVMLNLPEDVLLPRPTLVGAFFSPVPIKSFEHVVTYHSNGITIRCSWKVNFDSEDDMNRALREKQWQYMEGRCIRLMTEEDHKKSDTRRTWESIYHDLQLEIFSYFDVFQRAHMRSVCASWNDMLMTLWDGEVNRCLYFSFETTGHESMNCADEVTRAIKLVAAKSGNLCDKIPRLIFEFNSETKLRCEWTLTSAYTREVIDEFLLEHCHFNTVMIIGLLVDCWTIFTDLFMFNRMTRWPRTMTVSLLNCSIAFYHNFSIPCDHGGAYDPTNILSPSFDVSRLDTWGYTLPVRSLSFLIDQNVTEKERYIRLHKALDERRTFWPFPPMQLEWLKSLLESVPVDDAETLLEMNDDGEYSLRQAICRYLETDETRRVVDKWQPTGVFFEKWQLTWRDCWLLAVLADQLYGLSANPLPCHMKNFDLSSYYDPEAEDIGFEEPTEREHNQFTQAMAAMRETRPGHRTFDTHQYDTYRLY